MAIIESKVTLEDLKSLFKTENLVQENINSSLYVFNKIDTDGITYANIFFDISDFSKKDIQIISILTSAYMLMSSNKTSYLEFLKKLQLYGLSLNFSLYPIDRYEGDKFIQKLYFKISFKCLNEDLDNFLSLILELIFDGNYLDEKVHNLTQKDIKGTFDYLLKYNKEDLFIKTSLKRASEKHQILDIVSGLSFYSYIQNSNIHEEFKNAQKTILKALKKNRMIFFHSSDKTSDISNFVNSFDTDVDYVDSPFNLCEKNEDNSPLLYSFTDSTSFNSMVINAKQELSSLYCFSSILNQDVLWNLIRLKGNAYGTGSLYFKTGVFSLYSISDPNIQKTFKNFKKALKVKITDEDVQIAKKSTLSFLSDSLSIYTKVSLSCTRFLSRFDDEKRLRFIDDIISVRKSEICNAQDLLMNSDYYVSTISCEENLTRAYNNCKINKIIL